MYLTIVHLLTLISLSCSGDGTKSTVSCPDNQKAFGRSCYEFVDFQRTFFQAQAWCEQRGGHLVSIPDEETQIFLQGHLDPTKDMWLGVAPTASPNLQYPPAAEGRLSWLDDSQITYSNWVSRPLPGAACAHILRGSEFQWAATRECKKKLDFICQFESGRTIACAGHNTTLQCGPGQVLMVNSSFYGRKSSHYCRSTLTPRMTPRQHQCGWLDVTESMKAHCHGHQACQISDVLGSLRDPCPHLGSYLSLGYHCTDGLTLSVSDVAAVFDNITISVRRLLDSTPEKLSCNLTTGDGKVIDFPDLQGLEVTAVHHYTIPGAFVVAVECTSSSIHVAVEKEIAIQEPITGFGVIRCYAGNQSFHSVNCKALDGEIFQVQVEVKAGTDVTYRIQREKIVFSDLSVVKGNVPQNITLTAEMVSHLGPGCHQLTLYASNMVTFPEVSADLKVCVLEKVDGLQASALKGHYGSLHSTDISIGVSLERGSPVSLLFSLTGDNSSFFDTREMKKRTETFHFGYPVGGLVQAELRAWNVFSSLEVDVEVFASCGKDSVDEVNGYNVSSVQFNKILGNKRSRVVRAAGNNVIIATPSSSRPTKNLKIVLSSSGSATLPSGHKYQWKCTNPCGCQIQLTQLTYTIQGSCLPKPLEFNKYHLIQLNSQNQEVGQAETKCITFTPNFLSGGPSLTCTKGCDPVKANTDAKLKLGCGSCQNVVWNIEDPRQKSDWTEETEECYTEANQRPLTNPQNGGSEYTVSSYNLGLAKSNSRNLKVVVYGYGLGGVYYYKTYTIKTSSSSSSSKSSEEGDGGDGDTTDAPTAPPSPTTTVASTPPVTTSNPTTTPAPTNSPATTTGGSGTTTAAPPPTTTPASASPAATTSSATTTNPESTSSATTATPTIPPATTTGPASTSADPTTPNPNPPTTTTGPATTSTATDAPTTTAVTAQPSPGTTESVNGLSCSISPLRGTILDAFKITCNTETDCSNCQYCLKTSDGQHLRCTSNKNMDTLYLPLGDSSSNYNLIIKVTAKDGSFTGRASLTAQVKDSTASSDSSVDDLKTAVEKAVAKLKGDGELSGETLSQILKSAADKLNTQSDESKKDARKQLREEMIGILIDTLKEVPATSPVEVQVTASAINAVIQKNSELSSSAQVGASLALATLSSNLLNMDTSNTEESRSEIQSAANSIMEGTSSVLVFTMNKNISDAVLNTVDNTQSALLKFRDVNDGPAVIKQEHINVLVNRVSPRKFKTEEIKVTNCSCASFTLPKLPSGVLPSDGPLDIRMLSSDKNPFSWHERGNISGLIGALSLSTKDGSTIPVANLTDDIEILLPRPVEEQVNTSVLDLGNFSTTMIDIPSAETTLVLKMVPSEDPLPFKLLLGYMDYPTDTNHVAATEMPHQGKTLEERYTWLLESKDLKGNTGAHYLVVRPIVGPGIKSINANLSITPITADCKFWDESKLDWRTNGCRVGINTTHAVTQCLCNHLTFFGSSFFVTPNLVDPSRSAELFATFADNPVVVCFVGALFIAYFLVLVWARRKDVQDTAKVKVTVLEDNDPMDEYRYLLTVSTGYRRGASTSSQVIITLLGTEEKSEPHHLMDPQKCVFERGAVDMFLVTAPFSLGDLQGIRLWHNNSGSHPAWYVGNIMVQDLQTQQKWHFLCNSWLAVDIGDCVLDKVFPVSTEMDLKGFSNLFFTKTTKDFSDGHLWFSVVSRPPSSTFTCVQRVSCCFSLLLCTMLTSIMFYGIPTDPSEQTLDLGHFEFTWQQFMVGVQSSLIMFPINILIVSIFRYTRPRETSCCRRKTIKPEALEQISAPESVSTSSNVTLDSVIKDITRIAHSLSKTVKSNVPCTESGFGPGQQHDINAVLSVVEDFIQQNHKSSNTTQSKTQSSFNLGNPQQPESSVSVRPASGVEGIQKKSNKTQYLYQQLCHIERELSLLGPSGFPNPQSHSQALQQVHGMKGSLEDQLFKSSSANQEELTQRKPSPADSHDSDSGQENRSCCHGGLPWWFVFVGWLLILASSVVSGYFTMIYGLKFGKERSISWLVSMVISFFQSLLVIQPLKVLGIAVFFALVIKKVDEEDFSNVAFVQSNRNLGDSKDQLFSRDGGLYEPPAPADIERMRRNRILEQKAFALLKEILTYVGFMWMLLLAAYGQRDPNAFFLNRHIRHSFSAGITDSMSLGNVFIWADKSLLIKLFGVYPGFITDGNSKLVGNARLRQLRVKKGSCEIAGSMTHLIPDCHAPYSWEMEDMGSYSPGWNHSARDNGSESTTSPWEYQTHSQLRSYPFWGKLLLYRGGGFVAELGPERENASRTLDYLFRNKWLDMYTRALFVEFTVYNANVNLFCIVTLLLETSATGAFQFLPKLQSIRLYSSTGGLHVFVMAAEVLYMLFILYYMFLQGKLMKQQRCAYFRSKWNLLELTIISLSWAAVAVFIKRTLTGNRDMTYYQNHKDQFPSFYETATADSSLQYLIAFLVLLSCVKLWHLLRLNPKMNMITATLQRAWTDISSFLFIIVIMVIAYSTASNVIYGWRLSSYKTLKDALLTIISLQMGIFNYAEVLNGTPLLGGLLFGSCIVFMTFVVLNLLISVILVAFNQEQIYHKPSDEEEIVEVMLKNICSLFGVKYESTREAAGVDDSVGSDSTLNNGKSVLNNTAIEPNVYQTSELSAKL